MSQEDLLSFAVTVSRDGGTWVVRPFEDDFEQVTHAIDAVRGLRSEGAAFGLLCVEESYFVILRPGPGGTRMFISDAGYALEDEYAEAWLDLNDLDFPEADEEGYAEPYADGDFDILADLGLSEDQLAAYVDNEDDDPSDMLLRIAGELGFGDELEEVLEEASEL